MKKILAIAAILIAGSTMTGTRTGMAQPPRQGTSNNTINFLDNYIEVTGIGRPPDSDKGPGGFPLARRAALVDAYRNIAEATRGIQLDSQTDVRNMGAQISDRVVTAVSGKVQSCSVVDTEDALRAGYGAQGYVTLRCRANIAGSGGVLQPILSIVEPEIKKKFDEQKLPVFTPPPAPPQPAAPSFDGLIVRLPASFKPSAFPTIRTDKGEVVYSVDNVPLEIQSSRGLVKLTNDVSKASALLKDMGSTMPLTIDGSLYTDTDAQVKADDATKIVTANKKSSFLSSARVIFVIGKAQ